MGTILHLVSVLRANYLGVIQTASSRLSRFLRIIFTWLFLRVENQVTHFDIISVFGIVLLDIEVQI